jgi:hypothetical protein
VDVLRPNGLELPTIAFGGALQPWRYHGIAHGPIPFPRAMTSASGMRFDMVGPSCPEAEP